MNRSIAYFLCVFLFVAGVSLAQGKDEQLIDWNASGRLTWNDYKARPDPAIDAAALTTTYLGIEYNITSTGFSYAIQCRFSKDRSWGLHQTDYILEHEQGHFDIAEIFARKLNRQMKGYQFNRNSYQQDLKKIYNDIMDEKENFQDSYDKETNHSINKEKQAEWLIKIKTMLEDLKAYSNY